MKQCFAPQLWRRKDYIAGGGKEEVSLWNEFGIQASYLPKIKLVFQNLIMNFGGSNKCATLAHGSPVAGIHSWQRSAGKENHAVTSDSRWA